MMKTCIALLLVACLAVSAMAQGTCLPNVWGMQGRRFANSTDTGSQSQIFTTQVDFGGPHPLAYDVISYEYNGQQSQVQSWVNATAKSVYVYYAPANHCTKVALESPMQNVCIGRPGETKIVSITLGVTNCDVWQVPNHLHPHDPEAVVEFVVPSAGDPIPIMVSAQPNQTPFHYEDFEVLFDYTTNVPDIPPLPAACATASDRISKHAARVTMSHALGLYSPFSAALRAQKEQDKKSVQ